MKRILRTSVVFLCLSFLAAPRAFSQQDSTRYNNEDSEDQGDVPLKAHKHHKAAPDRQTGVAFGLEGGVNLANFIYGQTIDGENVNSNALIGGRIGVLLDIPIHGIVYIQPGVFYAMTGATSDDGSSTTNINTIEIPVNFMYKTGRPGDNRFFVGAGPYFGYNVSGTNSNGGTLNIGSDANDDINAIDIGIGVNAGFELRNGFFFRARYQRGLTNLATDPDNETVYSQSYGLQVGYLFHRKVRPAGPAHPDSKVWDQ